MIQKINGGFVLKKERVCGLCKKNVIKGEFYFNFFIGGGNWIIINRNCAVHKNCLFKELDKTKEMWKDEKKGYNLWLKRKMLKSLK